MTDNVLPLKMSAQTALKFIRTIAEKGTVVFHPHAKARMRKRTIIPDQVYSCLEKGVIIEGPSLDMKGCWRCTMYRFAAGDEIKIAVSIITAENLLVITVM